MLFIGLSILFFMILEKLRIVFSGVCNLWFMVVRKWDFVRLVVFVCCWVLFDNVFVVFSLMIR